MTIPRVRELGQWVNPTVLQGSEMEQLDAGMARALDGQEGGAYSTTSALVIGGEGIDDAFAETHVVGNVQSNGQYVVSNIRAHRLSITGGVAITGSIGLFLEDAPDGVKREIYIDALPAGCGIFVRNAGGQTITNGGLTCIESERRIMLVAERQNSAWRLVHHGADPSMFATVVGRVINTVSAPAQTPTINLLTERDTWLLSNNVGFSGSYAFAISNQSDSGLTRRVHVDRLLGNTVLAFVYGNSSIYTFIAGPGGAWNVELEFQAVDGWRLSRCQHGIHRGGNRTLVVNSIASSGGSRSVTVNTNAYDAVVVNEPLTSNHIDEYNFLIGDPIEEKQELVLWFVALMGTEERPVINIRPSNNVGAVIYSWTYSGYRVPRIGTDPPVYIQGTATIRLQVLGGQWRYMGMSY